MKCFWCVSVDLTALIPKTNPDIVELARIRQSGKQEGEMLSLEGMAFLHYIQKQERNVRSRLCTTGKGNSRGSCGKSVVGTVKRKGARKQSKQYGGM